MFSTHISHAAFGAYTKNYCLSEMQIQLDMLCFTWQPDFNVFWESAGSCADLAQLLLEVEGQLP